MTQAGTFPGPWPWAKSYPAGCRPDSRLDTWPVASAIDRSSENFGDRPAFVFRDVSLTYRELKAKVERAASAFLAAGLGPGARIALLLPNTLYHPYAFFGALKAGATIVHLSPLDSPRVLAHKLTDSGARTIVTTNIGDLAVKAEALLAEGLVDTLIVGEDEAFGPSALTGPMASGAGVQRWSGFTAVETASRFPDVHVDDLALLQYTGGTTGLPKGAMLSHANLSAAVSAYDLWSRAEQLSQPGKERVLLFLPLFHIYALVSVMLRALSSGQTLVMHTRFDPQTALAEIENGATSFAGVPTMWIALCALPGFEKRDLSSLRYCASGGAPLPVEVARKLNAMTGLELLGGWGMTETSPAGANIPKGRPDKAGTVGVPLPGIYMDIVALDDPRRVLKLGETGELRVFGPNVTRGYLNREEETRASFSDGGLLTGDIGYMDEDGFLFIVDRKKDMIISGGYNVYPQMIEQAIYEHPDIEEVLVIGVADPYRGEAAQAFVKLRDGAPQLTLDQLRAFLAGRLGRHEMPEALEIRPALPRTAVGKLSKLELKQEEAARRAAAASNTP
ncbi:dicarboxylate--CoA ligase PimA [Mesorhizobium sp. L-8-10]|uniref:AMP-binding protein n=1 Tax=Mesorhizobium sp. L-8-10 TaxID=2744523 RepID=UPI001925D96D|nr:AMP-binding protein [Mesorhizobium sp. L-8-10]BCH34411.1 dicarboxylate--CoA ligase PimA [Mesorhizobium sp. L-8-10]